MITSITFFGRLLRRGYPPAFLLSIFNKINFTQRQYRLAPNLNSKTPLSKVVLSPEFHPIWEQPQVKTDLIHLISEQQTEVSRVVSRYLPPLIAFKKAHTIGSFLIRATFKQEHSPY